MNNQRVGVDEPAGGSVGLIMSILVRYPEVSSIKYDPELKEIRFALMVGRLLSDAEFAAFRETLRANIDAYAYVTNREELLLTLDKHVFDNITVVEIVRNVETLCQEEISLIIKLSQDAFGSALIVDEGELLSEDEFDIQDGIIDQILDSLKDYENEKKLIGFREEGRVMVFNKTANPAE
jgi:hypothetical protein